MSRLVIKHNGKIPLISESYNKIGEWPYPYGIGMLVTLDVETSYSNVVWSTGGNTFTASQFNIANNGVSGGAATAIQPRAIAFSSAINRFVTFGGVSSPLPFVMYSDNLLTWATASHAFSAGQQGFDIDYSPSLDMFVAVGANKPQYSTTGIGWTLSTSTMGTFWNNVKWIDGLSKFIVTNISSSPYFASSTDGINWTTSTAFTLADVAYSDNLGRLVGVGNKFGADIAFSDDSGSTWTYITQSFASFTDTRKDTIAYSPQLDLFVIAGLGTGSNPFATNKYLTSKTGLTWSQVSGATNSWNYINWSNEMEQFWITPQSNYDFARSYAYSSDGVNWATASISAGSLTSGTALKMITTKNIFI
jgi:hypothetical protein